VNGGRTYEAWVERLSRQGEWGGNTTLQAAADAFGRPVNVVSVLGSAPYLFIRPEQGEVAGDGGVWIFYSGHARGREAHLVYSIQPYASGTAVYSRVPKETVLQYLAHGPCCLLLCCMRR
jgi:hypothetical protein